MESDFLEIHYYFINYHNNNHDNDDDDASEILSIQSWQTGTD